MLKLKDLLRNNDIVLAVGLVVVIGMMVLPLPSGLLDFLLTINISLSVIILLVCLFTKEPLEYSTFPTILLISTVFRLGLNVSSTRLILLHGEAGDVIHAFGEFVVGGNYVVGFVIFAILVIINFMVITGGAGRQGIIEEHSGIFQGQALPLHGAQTGPQAQAAGLVELCRREAAAQGGNIIAQQLEGGGAGLFQRHAVVGPERAVSVAAEPSLLDGNADIGGIFVPAVHIGEQGAGVPLRGGALPVGRECHQQLCQLAPGQGGAQGGGLFAGQAAQRHGSLHRRIAGSGICRHHQHRAGNANGQKKC